MFYRNLTLFRFPAVHDGLFQTPLRDDLDQLDRALAQAALVPVAPSQLASYGFAPPLAPVDGQEPSYVHRVDDAARITLAGEEKILPPAVVKRELAKRLKVIEERDGRAPGGRTRRQLAEDIVAELLPQAFIKPVHTDAYFDFSRNFIAVDASGRRTAETLVSSVRHAAGTFPAVPLNAKLPPRAVLTGWISGGDIPGELSLGGECELRDPAEDGAVVRIQNLELSGEEVQHHLQSGMKCVRLALCWQGHVSFVLGEDLVLRKLKFLDGAVDQLEQLEHDDLNAELDARFALMSMELRGVFDTLAKAFRIESVGEDKAAAATKPARRGRGALKDIERVEISVGGKPPIVLTGEQFSKLPKHAERFGAVVAWIRDTGKTSISGLQRHLKCGYNDAARWIEAMEKAGVVSPPNAEGVRTVIATPEVK